MTRNEKADFIIMMNQIAEATANPDPPSHEKIDFYFECLVDLPIETIRRNAIVYVQTNKSNKGFFPPVSYLRDPRDPMDARQQDEAKAIKAFEIIRNYLDVFYWPEFPESSMNTIRMKMEREGTNHLYPLLARWGNQILYEPDGVVRAGFIKAYIADRLPVMEKTELPVPEEVKQLTEKMKVK